jgi:hypothetical protein
MKKVTQSSITVDSSKMTDQDAEITEALNALFLVCKKYDVASFVRIVLNKGHHIGMNTRIIDNARYQDAYEYLTAGMGKWLEETSGGQIQTFKLKEEPYGGEE